MGLGGGWPVLAKGDLEQSLGNGQGPKAGAGHVKLRAGMYFESKSSGICFLRGSQMFLAANTQNNGLSSW